MPETSRYLGTLKFPIREFVSSDDRDEDVERYFVGWQGKRNEDPTEVTLAWKSGKRVVVVASGGIRDGDPLELRESAILMVMIGGAIQLDRARNNLLSKAAELSGRGAWSTMAVSDTCARPKFAERLHLTPEVDVGYALWETSYALIGCKGILLEEVSFRRGSTGHPDLHSPL